MSGDTVNEEVMETRMVEKKKKRRMTFVWIGFGGITLIVVTVVLVGLLMPERYLGESQVVYAKTAEEVWAAVLDYDSHPMTGKMKKRIQTQPSENDLPVWIEDMGHGELITVKTLEADRPRRMVREMTSRSVPMTSRWEYTFEPDGAGSRLTIKGVTDIRSGTWHVPIFRVMMVLGGGVKKGLDVQMDMVADTLGVEAKRE